jgi:undecaprenyl diphosphate synthase
MKSGVEVLTVYAFSTENWNRDPKEVSILMGIFVKYAENFMSEALSRDIRVHVLSTDSSKLPSQGKYIIHLECVCMCVYIFACFCMLIVITFLLSLVYC